MFVNSEGKDEAEEEDSEVDAEVKVETEAEVEVRAKIAEEVKVEVEAETEVDSTEEGIHSKTFSDFLANSQGSLYAFIVNLDVGWNRLSLELQERAVEGGHLVRRMCELSRTIRMVYVMETGHVTLRDHPNLKTPKGVDFLFRSEQLVNYTQS
ncbi:hypothetical protein BDW22DRAFT_1343995 [Trametopsis cervina]|nr:hypothetical protein BDW22DRAFT_1343995 [Trametopsis cervina]